MVRYPILLLSSAGELLNTSRSSRSGLIVVLLLTLLLYSVGYILLYPFLLTATPILSTVPIVALAWMFGTRMGILAAALTLPLNLGLPVLTSPGELAILIVPQPWLIGSTALLFVSVITGKLADFRRSAQRELLERIRIQELAERRDIQLQTLSTITAVLTKHADFKERVGEALDLLLTVLDVGSLTLRVPAEDPDGLRLFAAASNSQGSSKAPTFASYDTIPGRSFLSGEDILIDDLALSPESAPTSLRDGLLSLVSVPVSVGDRKLGVITAAAREAGHFTPDKLEMFRNVGSNFGTLLENVGLWEAESLRRQEMEALFRIARILVGAGSFEERLTLTLNELATIAQADWVHLAVPDANKEVLNTLAKAGPLSPEIDAKATWRVGEGLTGAAYLKGVPIVTNDYAAYGQAVPSVAAQGIRSALALPIQTATWRAGVVVISSQKTDHFPQERVDLLSAIANEVGALLDNARLNDQISQDLERRRQRLEAFRAVIGMLTLELNPNSALQKLVDAIREIVGISYAALVLWDEEDHVSSWLMSGFTPQQAHAMGPPPAHSSLPGLVREKSRFIRLDNAVGYVVFDGHQTPASGSQSFLGAPINVRGVSRGVIYFVDDKPSANILDDDESLLDLFAVIAGVLLDNMELYDDVARRHATLASIQESMTEGLVVLDSNLRVIYCNQAMVTLWNLEDVKPSDLLGLPIAMALFNHSENFVAPSDAEGDILRVIDGAVEGPLVTQVEIAHPQRRDLTVTAFPIPIEHDHDMTGLLVRDVTEQRNLDRRRDAFVSTASHELRTPTSAILGHIDLLFEEVNLEPRHAEWLRRTQRNAERLSVIVDDMLSLTRIQSGKLQLDVEPLDVSHIVDEVLATIAPTTDNHEFVTSIPQDMPKILADAGKAIEIVSNLVVNAVKYSPNGGRVTISSQFDPVLRRVVFTVADQGIGIASEDLDDVFKPFHRISRGETQKVRGSGLGLSIVKGLTEMMGGEVWSQSTLNKGSAFSFTLPTEVEEAGEPEIDNADTSALKAQ